MKFFLRWFPAVLLLGLFGVLWKTAVSGSEQGVVAWLTLISGLPMLGGIVLVSAVGMFLWKRKLNASLMVTILAALLIVWPYFWRFGILPMAYPISLETTTPAATVRLPADEPILVAWGGDTPSVNYHVTFPNARWAYDLVVMPAFHGNSNLEAYGCWGVPVLAPAAGEIVVTHDGEKDVPIGEEHESGTPHQGNHVFIRIEGNTYIAIGHFQQNSIVVNIGDMVAEGDVLGKCGNSGSSDEPHIHIHHQLQDPRTTTSDLAEGLPLYFRDHNGLPMPEGGSKLLIDKNGNLQGPIMQHEAGTGLD